MSDSVVVKLGGTTLSEAEGFAGQIRGGLVIVHGGGKRLTEWLDRAGIQSEFVNGLRSTSDAALDVAIAVLGGLVNGELVAALRSAGVDAVGMTGIDGGLLSAERRHELGRVGRVTGVRTAFIDKLLADSFVPVVAPLALDENGEPCNVNADEAASAIAAALGARLVLLTDTNGVLDGAGERIANIDADQVSDLIESGVIGAGMVPKVSGALAALKSGASDVLIADGRAPNALARALADDDFGTRVTRTS